MTNTQRPQPQQLSTRVDDRVRREVDVALGCAFALALLVVVAIVVYLGSA